MTSAGGGAGGSGTTSSPFTSERSIGGGGGAKPGFGSQGTNASFFGVGSATISPIFCTGRGSTAGGGGSTGRWVGGGAAINGPGGGGFGLTELLGANRPMPSAGA